MTDDFARILFDSGVILPDRFMSAREIWHYRASRTFYNDELKQRYQICPTLFKVGFNVLIQEEYHSYNIESRAQLYENFPRHRFETVEDMLAFAEEPQFYLVENVQNLEGTDILGHEYHECLLVLMRIQPSNPLGEFDLYSAEELTASFLAYEDFIDPHAPGQPIFPKRHLQRICRIIDSILDKDSRNNDLIEVVECFCNVLESIEIGITHKNNLIERIQEYAHQNETLTRGFFGRLVDVAMRMRGWSGEGEYPLSSQSTMGDVNETEVTERLHRLYMRCQNKYENLGQLPIFRYTREQTFESSVRDDIGQTIIDKIRIVLENQTDHACIRMSSNWLAASAWYYMNKFFEEDIFPINELSEIQ